MEFYWNEELLVHAAFHILYLQMDKRPKGFHHSKEETIQKIYK